MFLVWLEFEMKVAGMNEIRYVVGVPVLMVCTWNADITWVKLFSLFLIHFANMWSFISLIWSIYLPLSFPPPPFCLLSLSFALSFLSLSLPPLSLSLTLLYIKRNSYTFPVLLISVFFFSCAPIFFHCPLASFSIQFTRVLSLSI